MAKTYTPENGGQPIPVKKLGTDHNAATVNALAELGPAKASAGQPGWAPNASATTIVKAGEMLPDGTIAQVDTDFGARTDMPFKDSAVLGLRNASNYVPGDQIAPALGELGARGQERGTMGQIELGQYGQAAAGLGNESADYGIAAGGNAMNAGANAAAAGDYAAGYGRAGADLGMGAMGNAYGMAPQITDAGNAAAQVGQQGMAGAYGAAQNVQNLGMGGLREAEFGQGQAEAGRSAQMGAAGQLAGLEATEGPSAAQAMLRQNTSANLQDQLALAGSGRGYGGGAAATSQALRQMPGMQAAAANQATQLRAQENAAWRQRQGANLANAAGAYGNAAQTGLGQGQLGLAGQNLAAQSAAQAGQLGLAGTQAAQAGYGQQAQAAQAAGNLGLAGADRALAGIGQGMQGEQARMQGAQTQGQLNVAGGQLGLAGLNQGIQGQVAGGQLAGQGRQLGFQGDAQMGAAIAQDQAAKQQYESMLTQQMGIKSGVSIANAQSANNFFGSMVGAGGTLAAAGLGLLSDERQKRVGQPVKMSSAMYGNPYGRRGAPGNLVMSDERNKRELSELRDTVKSYAAAYGGPPATEGVRRGGDYTSELDRVASRGNAPDFRNSQAYAYEYKDPSLPGAAPGPQVGPMAQDLEMASPSSVVDTPQGKMVDTSRLTMANSSAIGEQQARQDDLDRQMEELKRMLAGGNQQQFTAPRPNPGAAAAYGL